MKGRPMASPIYIFAGGGTGGHLVPALAVAEELTTLAPDARIVFACSDRPIDRRILDPTPHAVVVQPVRPMPRGLRGWPRFATRYLAARRLARDMVRDLSPVAVFALGGFAAAPVASAAARAGIRTALLSIDAVPGLANRLLARRAGAIFAQFERTAGGYGRYGGKVRVVGCPVRAALASGDRDEAARALGLRTDRRGLLIMAGSLGAANINEAAAGIRPDLDALAGEWQVLHVAGPGKGSQAERAWAGADIHAVTMEFCERMDLAYAAADVVLCRAGAATVGELAATGTPAVLMPYPHHRDQQQRHNAAAPAEDGAAVVVPDACDPAANAQRLRESLVAILRDPARLEAMQSAAEARKPTGAARAIAEFLAG